ncbi:cytochrome bd biosynthesis protein [Yersinia entomophaga]|uniref:Cytochrome bd biosynthesis protein n=2 Tax=Yersinia TaxID=629 RepID=A0ABM6BGK0_YERET|nr:MULTISPECIES: cytochrome bd-I oxidase subunit CydX [Yersinia]ANI28512.1 cytochrome bd biosynthesis protein [Yersinia entomophaga]MDN0087885.1 cytochrome bd-I oxidase subunit CydX [Yersinia nurmii]OWF88497.1 cyd operon protein YbgT [Yersinia entomophaga]CND98945.1 cyd operon protein YbgT [Yersinia nurmii]
MWYFAWILGTLLACSFGIITALALEQSEANAAEKKAAKNGSEDVVR